MTFILDDITRTVQQAVELLRELPVSLYVKFDAPAYESTIGAHLRHNIDHYHSFIEGVSNGKVDYDHRNRDQRLETDIKSSIAVLGSVIANLSEMAPESLEDRVLVRMDCGGDAVWSQSSVRRELQFLLSHTVHHYAIIAMICRLNGHQPSADFGVAPSTLKFHDSQQIPVPCAL